MTSTPPANPTAPANAEAPIRLIVQQPALPHYRNPVFAELATRPGIDLRLVYADVDALPNVEPDGFTGEHRRIRSVRLGRHRLSWHAPQWTMATRDATDVLLLSWNLGCASLVPGLLRARRQGVGTVLWGHGYSKSDSWWRAGPRRRVTTLATALLFYNERVRQTFIDDGGDARRLFVAPNAIGQASISAARDAWLADPERLGAFQAEHGLARGPVVVFVSRLAPANRLDLLVRATHRLRDDFPDLQVVVIGKGDEERDRLIALASDLQVTERIRFVGGIYGEDRIAPWMLSADLFCYPSNIGLSVLHAFGYGVPAIAGDAIDAHNPEIESLHHGENGLLFAHGDEKSLSDTLRSVFEAPELLARLKAGATETARSRYTLERMVDGMEAAVRFAHAHARG